ncbi:F-box DNA helicase 1 [Globomyces sp. JEL0801]|nr:F-box DNA helicase 1 [Globomyces sp. JEL0801]
MNNKKLNSKGNAVRIVAGAGTGKTSTIHLLIQELLLKNQKVLYIVFNKAAQLHANRKFKKFKNSIECKTMHSICLSNLQGHLDDGFVPSNQNTLTKAIETNYETEIIDWLKLNNANGLLHDDLKTVKRKVALVTFWIYKTLEEWIRSDKRIINSVYYHARQNHMEQLGFPEDSMFYIQAATEIWNKMWKSGGVDYPIEHDCYVKYAQLGNLNHLDYDCIMIDEAQDASMCQMDLFVNQQVAQQKNVYLFGDAVQAIYSFRGAKSRYLTALPNTTDFHLTNCFRFGKNISHVANLFLHAKEYSGQVNDFTPYRLTGLSTIDGIVTERSLEYPYTAIGRSHSGIIIFAIELTETNPDVKLSLKGSKLSYKILIRKSKEVYQLYRGQRPRTAEFRRYESFQEFDDTVRLFEMKEYGSLIDLVRKYHHSFPKKIAQFEQLLSKNLCRKKSPDVTLITTHQAKGLEFDRVQVLNDFTMVETNPDDPEFCIYGADELNLWYVAVTRAKKELSLPKKYWELYSLIHSVQNGYADSKQQKLKELFEYIVLHDKHDESSL